MDDTNGVVSDPLEVVGTALREANATGRAVIVGLHAPPFNISGNENAFYFRETQRAETGWPEIVGFLLRRDPAPFVSPQGFYLNGAMAKHSGWVKKEQQPRSSCFLHGELEGLIEYSVSKGRVAELLHLCMGQRGMRGADLILCGHLHQNVEFRLAPDQGDGFCFYMDFYTENPTTYYATFMLGPTGMPDFVPLPSGYPPDFEVRSLDKEKRHVYVEVTRDVHPWLASPKSDWWDHTYDPYWRIQVPTYATPLNETRDAPDWWMQRRPLIIQTGGVGPLDTYQRPIYKDDSKQPTKPNATFQGFRVISVRDNTISRIHYARLAELRERNFEMPWEPPDIRRSYAEVFGREPREEELSGWLKDPQTEGKTFEQVVSQHIEFLISPGGSEELREMIERSYWAAFGREPAADETLAWVNAVKADRKTYDVIVRQHVDYMLSAAGSQELEEMVRRSYLVALTREPRADELAWWVDAVKANRYTYLQLIEAHEKYKAGGGA